MSNYNNLDLYFTYILEQHAQDKKIELTSDDKTAIIDEFIRKIFSYIVRDRLSVYKLGELFIDYCEKNIK